MRNIFLFCLPISLFDFYVQWNALIPENVSLWAATTSRRRLICQKNKHFLIQALIMQYAIHCRYNSYEDKQSPKYFVQSPQHLT